MTTPTAHIFGAGVTGLSAGWKLAEGGVRVNVVDKNPFLGGLATTFQHGDFRLDQGPHKLFTLMEDVMNEIRTLIGPDLLRVKKQSRIRLKGRYLNYPVGIKDLVTGFSPAVALRCAASYAAALLAGIGRSRIDTSYEDWVVHRFGRAIFDLVFGPYARKIWGEPKTLAKDLAQTRVAIPSLYRMITQMVLGIGKNGPIMSAEYFHYPRNGALTLSEKMAEKIDLKGGQVLLGQTVTAIHHDGRAFTGFELDGHSSVPLGAGDVVIGTLPLSLVLGLLRPSPSPPVMESGRALRTRSLILLYLIVDKPRLTEDNWIFFPGPEYLFNRIFEQKNFSPFMGPPDRTAVCLEITCDTESETWKTPTDTLASKCIDQLVECGLLRAPEVLEYFDRRIRGVYQIYDLDYKANSRRVIDYLDRFENFYTIGRHGAFNYVGQADCMDMGMRTASHILQHRGESRETLRQAFDSYAVID